jgi:hypothetical protein
MTQLLQSDIDLVRRRDTSQRDVPLTEVTESYAMA